MMTKRGFRLGAVAVAVVAAITAFLLVSALSGSADSTGGTATLEEGGNINLALREAQQGRGPSLVGNPTAIYGKIMTYRDALEAIGANAAHVGASQAWRLDRTVHLYVFEGNILDADPKTSDVSDWAQIITIADADTGYPFRQRASRSVSRIDVAQFLPLSMRDDAKDVPPREIESLNLPLEIPVDRATPAPPAP